MKLVIDVDEKDWEFLKESDGCRWSRAILEGVINGTPLPKGHEVIILPGHASNGDAVRAAFPNAFFDSYVDQCDGVDFIAMENEEIYFDLDWWNAPYKESEDKE